MKNANLALNRWMSPRMPLLILLVLVIGLAFSGPVSLLCPYVTALMCFQTFSNSLGGTFRDLLRVLSHPKPVLAIFLALHVLMPLAALAIGTLLFPDRPLYTLSLVLEEASPAAVSSLMWMVIGGGNVELCLSVVLLDTILSPVILPLTLRLLCGSVVALDTAGLIRDLIIMIVIPAALSMLFCRAVGKETCAKLKTDLGSATKITMLVIICANVTRCVPLLQRLDTGLLALLAVTFFMRLLGLVMGWALARLFRFPYETALTVTVNSSMRNNAAAGTLAAEFFPADVVFSPSVSPVFSQLCVSIAVRLFQRRREW